MDTDRYLSDTVEAARIAPEPLSTQVVVVLAHEGISPFLLSVPLLAFGETFDGALRPRFEVRVCAEDAQSGAPVARSSGVTMQISAGLESLDDADIVVIPSSDPSLETSAPVLDALRAAHARGVELIGLCRGAFTVTETGLLDGGRAVTHWLASDELARRHPRVQVDRDSLWVRYGSILTSAGASAALDCCLHVVDEHLGAEIAGQVSRLSVMAPHRSGDQVQVHSRVAHSQSAAGDPVAEAMAWALERLAGPITLSGWSAAVSMSPRTLSRRFRASTGLSPYAWLTDQRMLRARSLLESGEGSVEAVACSSGFGSAQILRRQFREHLDTTPTDYRRRFGPRSPRPPVEEAP